VATKNGQSKDTGNVRNTRHKAKTSTTQKHKTTLKRLATRTPPTHRGGETR
jgi:hypothetical protein